MKKNLNHALEAVALSAGLVAIPSCRDDGGSSDTSTATMPATGTSMTGIDTEADTETTAGHPGMTEESSTSGGASASDSGSGPGSGSDSGGPMIPVDTPTYLDDVEPFETIRLSTTANGAVNLRDVIPAAWEDAEGLGNPSNITGAWSGGAGDGVLARLYVHGGGHNDSANNGLYVYDFSGDAEPTGWELLDISEPSAAQPGNLYTDDRPSSVHTYDYSAFDVAEQTFLRYAGARWNDGSMNGEGFAFDVDDDAWTQTVTIPFAGDTTGWTVFEPLSRKAWVAGHAGGSFFHRVDAGTASDVVEHAGSALDQIHVYDSSRERALVIGNGNVDVFEIDWDAEAVTHSTGTPSGDTAIIGETGMSAVYDAEIDRVWILLPRYEPFDRVWEMNPANLEIVEHSLTGATAFEVDGSTGSFNRVVFVPEWRAIGFVTSIDDAAYVLKLP